MARTLNEGLARAPTFTPHRVNVAAVDSTTYTTLADIPEKHGLMSSEFNEVVAHVKPTHATPDVDVEVLFWSPLNAAFVPQVPAVKFEGIDKGTAIRFTADGQRFFLYVTGTFDRVDIDVAGVRQDDQLA